MFVELGLLATGNYLTYRYLNNNFLKFKKIFDNVIQRLPELQNNQKENIKLLDYALKDYGFEIKISLPIGITTQNFQENILSIKEAFKLSSIHLEIENDSIILYGIKNYIYKVFKPVVLLPYQILIGEFLENHIIVDMNKFPHVLIAGDTGTGKSRLFFTIITNLINNSNKVSLYLLQVRKNDLFLFKNYRQVKRFSETLESVRDSLKEIDNLLLKRENNFKQNGYFNIVDYNKNSNNFLKYIYVFIEEFSFLNVTKADSKDEKALKEECLKYLKNLVNVGRSSGVFLITSLQKPTSDSIPTDIKSQLRTRISLNIQDKSTSQIVMGDYSAVDLSEREFVCKTTNIQKGYSLTIDEEQIIKNINFRGIKNE